MDIFSPAVKTLNKGGIAVIPTDTIYGIVARALDQSAVKRIYLLKQRSKVKPLIILISKIDDLEIFKIDKKWKSSAEKYWPGPNSLIFPCYCTKYNYLTLATNSLAIRLPDNKNLLSLIDRTGPLVAPSANPNSLPPARDIVEAKKYFGGDVDCYIDGGRIKNTKPSTLIDIKSGKILR